MANSPPHQPLTPLPMLPPEVYYLSTFITPLEESSLLSTIAAQPLPTWRQLSHRRLQAHPSVLSASNTLLEQPLPSWLLEPVIRRLGELRLAPSEDPGEARKIFERSQHGAPNHVLVNEYESEQGIFPHEDGDAYFPVVCTVSLGSHAVYDLYPKGEGGMRGEKAGWRVLQERRSLLVTMGGVYEGCLHGIEGVGVDEEIREGEGGVVNWEALREETREAVERDGGRLERGKRVSLTCRDVVRVKRLKGLRFGKK